MSRPRAVSNLETLARLTEAVRTMGDPPEELVWPDFEIHEHQLLDSRLHTGLAGWRRWVADWTASFPEWEIERLETVKLDDRRILTTHKIWARGRWTGMRFDERHAQIWQFRDGRLERMDYFPSEEDAKRAGDIV
jgi:hypothetical protein